MLKKSLGFAVLLGLSLSLTPALAAAPQSFPGRGVEVAPNVFSLGRYYDSKIDSYVEGYKIVHKAADVKSNASRSPKSPTCYGFLASGARWKGAPEDWVMNPVNPDGLNQNNLFTTEANDIQKWETAAGVNILGDGHQTNSTLVADETAMDNQNEVLFGDLGANNTIAVTIVWGYFSGPTFSRQLLEWDQVFNTHYHWTDSNSVTDKMNFENISTHELGHAVGMADIYTSTCSDVTMYGYGAFGETKKQTLEPADVTGISTLY